MQDISPEVENQLSFIRKGEQAYALALELGKQGDKNDENEKSLIAAAATDLGTNLLSQARVLSMALGEGSGCGTKTSLSDLLMQSSRIKDLITRSVNAYVCALDYSPHEALAWCGLGCALMAADPLLSQHCFCRALQLDASLADAWSNIGSLYVNFDTEKCSEMLDFLTGIEDTPLMWIGRGLLLEKKAREWEDQDSVRKACMVKAADAYRAALQIWQHPMALLGLALTTRQTVPSLQESNNAVYSSLADSAAKFESRTSMVIHQNMTGESNIGASYVSGLMQIEESLQRFKEYGVSESGDLLLAEGQATLNRGRVCSESEGESSPEAPCEIDLSVSKSLHMAKSVDFPQELLHNAVIEASSLSPSKTPEKVSDSSSSPFGLGEARQDVYLNPDSGVAWLTLAKQFAQELSMETKNLAILSSAQVAAKKAFDLLRDQVTNAKLIAPSRQAQRTSSEFCDRSVVSSIPTASLVSESISLISWLKEVESLDSEGSLSVTEEQLGPLQESYLLDPSNPVAAGLLGLTA